MENDIPTLVCALQGGSRAALAKLLTLAAVGRQSATLVLALEDVSKHASPVIALTGSGGVGKSSLVGALAAHFAEQRERIGILACDPESPITGGALLGDRCRIAGNSSTERIFIRSLSTSAGHQGIASNIELMLNVMRAFGFDRIFVETVGSGQGDCGVRRIADVVVLVLQPQTGDELQWEKAGILEVADMVVVNKSDLAGADQTLADVSQQLQTTGERNIPVVKTSVARREGIEEFCRAIQSAAGSSHARKKLPQHEKSNPLTI